MNPKFISGQNNNNSNSAFDFRHSEWEGDFREGRQWITPDNCHLILDGCTQTRIREDRGIIKRYGQLMLEGHWNWFERGEPIILFWDKEKGHLYCGDGHHRLKAARAKCLEQIYVEIRFGTLVDAKIYNCTSNGAHGNPTTHRDKRNQIMTLLKSLEQLPLSDSRRRWSDRQIAGRIGVDHKTVGKVRRKLLNPPTQEEQARMLQKKALNQKNRQFSGFRKLIQECSQQELGNYLKQVDSKQLSKLKLVMETINPESI